MVVIFFLRNFQIRKTNGLLRVLKRGGERFKVWNYERESWRREKTLEES